MCYLECLRASSTPLPSPAGHEERPSLKIAHSYWNLPSHNYKFSKYILHVPALYIRTHRHLILTELRGHSSLLMQRQGFNRLYCEAEHLPHACLFLQIFIRSNSVVWERLAVTPECPHCARPCAKRGEIAVPQLY